DLKKYWRQAHVFVFPTLLEGSAKVVYEAMSYGLPVITTFKTPSVSANNLLFINAHRYATSLLHKDRFSLSGH
ncbi:MAG: glycosyltransferase family 4 protein, partial [Planctomycetota bacterium]